MAPSFIQLLRPKNLKAIFDSSFSQPPLSTSASLSVLLFKICLEFSHLYYLFSITMVHSTIFFLIEYCISLSPICSSYSLQSSYRGFFSSSLSFIIPFSKDPKPLLWPIRSYIIWLLLASPSHYHQSPLCSSLTTLTCLFFQHCKLILTSRTLLFTVPGAQNIAQTSSACPFLSVCSLLRCYIIWSSPLTTLFKWHPPAFFNH